MALAPFNRATLQIACDGWFKAHPSTNYEVIEKERLLITRLRSLAANASGDVLLSDEEVEVLQDYLPANGKR